MTDPGFNDKGSPLDSATPARRGRGFDWRRIAAKREVGVAFLLLLTVSVAGFVNHAFLSIENIRDMLVKASPALIVGCGLTLVIVTSEIDISVGSLMGLSAAVLGLLCSKDYHNWPVWAAVLVTLALATGVGVINGLLVTVGKVPSIIVTLGMLTALRGVTQLLMGGEWIKGLPQNLRYLGTGSILYIPISVLTAAIIVILFAILTTQTPIGRRIYAIGSNPKSARLAGVSETRIKLFVFAITGLLTGIATVVYVPQLSVIDAERGKAFELLVVTCVVVGGTSISGGKGSIGGTVLGVLMLSIVGTVLIFLQLGERATFWERAIQGAFILLAVLADHLLTRKREGHG